MIDSVQLHRIMVQAGSNSSTNFPCYIINKENIPHAARAIQREELLEAATWLGNYDMCGDPTGWRDQWSEQLRRMAKELK